ncbi:MAG: PEP-CTERM sorting domain-containing protein [Isosphaeraceae bacterium]
MRLTRHAGAFALAAAFLAAATGPARAADLIVNGSFELGFNGWVRADQAGGDGTFSLQTGTASPINGLPVAAPPAGLTAAMSDGGGPGSHVLYQDFVVTSAPTNQNLLTLQLFISNSAQNFFTPAGGTLDFSVAAFNQQARIDIMKGGTNPFSVAAADVLQNIYQTKAGDPLVSGYSTIKADLTAVLAANVGQTLRLRIAEVDNVNLFNLGVDAVSISAVPEPSTLTLAGAGLVITFVVARVRRKRTAA